MTNQTVDCTDAAEKSYAERPRYFPRQLITPDDLTLGQDYLRNKIRRLNRFLHGWGVVCGALVRLPAEPQPWKVLVTRGYMLAPTGDEILIDRERCFDLRKRCITGASGDACSEMSSDPWCNDMPPQRPRAGQFFVAVRYKEILSRPVRVQPIGCGCGENQCEYSRWRDGYEICVLDRCPDSHLNPPDIPDDLHGTLIPECPECPKDPWVVLAAVTVDEAGTVTEVDNCGCRRMLVSLAPFWWRCANPADRPPGGGGGGPTPVAPQEAQPGAPASPSAEPGDKPQASAADSVTDPAGKPKP